MSVLEARAPWAQGLESAQWQGMWWESVRTDDFDWVVSRSQIAFVQVGGFPPQHW